MVAIFNLKIIIDHKCPALFTFSGLSFSRLLILRNKARIRQASAADPLAGSFRTCKAPAEASGFIVFTKL
jgi:hypothetical protein